VRALRDARGALLFATGTSLPQRQRRIRFARRSTGHGEETASGGKNSLATCGAIKEPGVAAIGHRRLLLKAVADLAADAGRATAEDVRAASPANATAGAERRQLTVMFYARRLDRACGATRS